MDFPNNLGTDSGDNLLIATAEDLRAFSDYVTADNDCAGLKFKLANDLDLSSVNDFKPIGGDQKPFKGTFDGDGHTISNLVIQSDENRIGLFGNVSKGGEIRNVKLENLNFSGLTRVGGIAGANNGKITDCAIKNCKLDVKKWDAGAVAGYNLGEISGCFVENCDLTGESTVGGIVGNNSGEITSCKVVYATLNGKASVGGIAGHNDSRNHKPKISNCYVVIKDISANDGKQGGIVSYNPKPGIASGEYYGDSALLGVGNGSGDNNTQRLYKLSLPEGITATSNGSFDICGETYYKHDAKITLDGSLALGDEIIILGSQSNQQLDDKTFKSGSLEIVCNCSLPVDSFVWSDVEDTSAAYKKTSYALTTSDNKIICAATENDLFKIKGINSTEGISIDENNAVTVPKANRVALISIFGEGYGLTQEPPAEEEEITLNVDPNDLAIDNGFYKISLDFTATFKVTPENIKMKIKGRTINLKIAKN